MVCVSLSVVSSEQCQCFCDVVVGQGLTSGDIYIYIYIGPQELARYYKGHTLEELQISPVIGIDCKVLVHSQSLPLSNRDYANKMENKKLG